MKKTLICITTCNRIFEIKKYIWDYIKFVNTNENFHFVLALDGCEKQYLSFCEKFDIPLVYSEKREGVGLSKNRVLEKFPNFDFYFFIEDDVELLDGLIFNKLISISESNDIPHLCANKGHEVVKNEIVGKNKLCYTKSGGGYFTLYTREGLKKVGGWNTNFAKYRRFGHTEHSFRFYHAGLQKFPFIFPTEDGSCYFLLHDPPSVSIHTNMKTNEINIIDEEQQLIDQKTSFFPLKTLSKYYFNNRETEFIKEVETFLKRSPGKYPLTFGKERRYSIAEYHALKIDCEKTLIKKMGHLLRAILNHPNNNALKHWLKTKVRKIK